jgi:hypothetical protein
VAAGFELNTHLIHPQTTNWLISAFVLASLTACEDECSNYSANRLNCDQIEKASYNAYFNLPDDTELSLGKITGLSNCAAKASDYANQHAVPKHYVCCMITETSSCAEKHR